MRENTLSMRHALIQRGYDEPEPDESLSGAAKVAILILSSAASWSVVIAVVRALVRWL